MNFVSRFKVRTRPLGFTTAVAFALLLGPGEAASQTAMEIVDQVDQLLRGESSEARIAMEIETANWSRTLEMEVWSLGTDFALVRVLSPAKEAGTATLKADQEVWNYLPRVDRTIKVPPSLMMGSWMGSHVTNDDLVKESRLIEDYHIEISFEGTRDGIQVWEFSLTPRPDAPVVWGRIVEEVRKADMMPTWVHYYDEDETLIRTMIFEEFQVMGGRMVPARMTIRPEDKPEERTVILYESLEFDVGLEESFFSLRNLRATR